MVTYAITYSALISTCDNSKVWPGHEGLEKTQCRGVVTYVITYIALISVCDKGWEPCQALKLFQTMQL